MNDLEKAAEGYAEISCKNHSMYTTLEKAFIAGADWQQSQQCVDSKYLNKFAERMMMLSNRLNEIDDDDYHNDAHDIKESYHDDIREFIAKVTGL